MLPPVAAPCAAVPDRDSDPISTGPIDFVEELLGANTQGATLDEARANLQEAVAMVLEANRELAQQATGTGPVIREPFKVSA